MIISAFGAIIDKTIIDIYLNPLQFLFLVMLFLTIHFFSFSLFTYGFKGIKKCFREGKKDAFFSALFWNVEIFFYLSALSLQFVSLVIPIKRLSTIFTTIGGGTIFKDKGLYLKAAACIIMFIGAFFVVI